MYGFRVKYSNLRHPLFTCSSSSHFDCIHKHLDLLSSLSSGSVKEVIDREIIWVGVPKAWRDSSGCLKTRFKLCLHLHLLTPSQWLLVCLFQSWLSSPYDSAVRKEVRKSDKALSLKHIDAFNTPEVCQSVRPQRLRFIVRSSKRSRGQSREEKADH